MHGAHLGRVVRIAVVALGEDVDGVDMAHLERFDKDVRVEICANISALGRGVEVQVDLAKAVAVWHGNSLIIRDAGEEDF